MIIKKVKKVSGSIKVPGDKSISHRSIMLGSLAKGTTSVINFLKSSDCLSTISCFRSMGIEIEESENRILVHGKGLHGLSMPERALDCGNSGTTMRLLSGILSPQHFESVLTGDSSLQKRPMKRIITPLSLMGASIKADTSEGTAPLFIKGSTLHGISYDSPVSSAQVKSAILLAGLYADGITSVTEPSLSRNHTELMLKAFGGQLEASGNTATVHPANELYGTEITVPGDISSAVYFMALGLLIPDSEIFIRNVGINPTRSSILPVLSRMGADITLMNCRREGFEPVCDILCRSSSLHGTIIEGDAIPTMIDELPVIAMLAAFAEGTTIIRDAHELRVKECDRISVMTENLIRMGADVEELEDGMIIHGGKPLHGSFTDPHGDHRIAMTFAVCAMACDGETELSDPACVTISYPEFFHDLSSLTR